jgi:hypothetical protein
MVNGLWLMVNGEWLVVRWIVEWTYPVDPEGIPVAGLFVAVDPSSISLPWNCAWGWGSVFGGDVVAFGTGAWPYFRPAVAF